MIVEKLLEIIARIHGWFLGLVDALLGPIPEWLTDGPAAEGLTTIAGWLDKTDAWIPWPLVGAVIAACAAAAVAAVAIKAVRIVASFVTLGGGSAA